MRISVVMAYYDRPQQLGVTLDTYRHWYTGLDYEVVIIDDGSPGQVSDLNTLASERLPGVPVHIERYERPPGGIAKNPGPLYNLGVSRAKGDLILLTNPENAHIGPVLQVAADTARPGQYLVFGCLTLNTVTSAKDLLANPGAFVDRSQLPHGYYQHSRWSNRLLHFAAAVYREDFLRIGGFVPAYDSGDAFEDNDLAERVARDLDVVVIDDPVVGHQAHGRHTPAREAYRMNHLAFQSRWGRNPGEFVRSPEGRWVPR